MTGDFTRGFNPDTKRGAHYRRVLLQQGRALLDSDMAALTDAVEGSLRQNLAMTTCHAGSPDLGLLVTPGRLLAQFDGILGNRFSTSGGAEVVRDYSRKYLDRLPGLRMGTGGTVTIALSESLDAPTLVQIWAHADNGGATPAINGTPVPIPAGPDYQPVDVSLAGPNLVIEPDPAARIWIALVETRADSAGTAALHAGPGSYEIDGLAFATPGGPWPGLADPAGAALAAASAGAPGQRMIAYVELWERHITALEDPGIRETALGGDLDTTTRTELRHQVKLAPISGLASPAAVAAAFADMQAPDGTVTLGVANETPVADPCDLPVPGGYTGPENRLYRLEVHGQAGGGAVLFKWSRDNGSELFRAAFPEGVTPPALASAVAVSADSDLRDGDLVELLSEAIDLGDAAPGSLGPAGFVRPRRSVGRLLRLSGGEEITGSVRLFDLRDPIDETPVTDVATAEFGTDGLKLRRWSGLIRHGADAMHELEHGITADIAGSAFEPGDWWQYEARVGAANANGPARPAPHGPERLFAPLAIVRHTPAGTPMRLEAWLDRRFPRLCEIEADDLSYDGARVESESATVQEALDELFERDTGEGCGEIAVPEGGDIRDVIDAIPPGGDARICLGAGTRAVPSVIEVADKGHVTITGLGLGSVLQVARPTFRFRNCRAVTLVDFAISADSSDRQSILRFDDCRQVELRRIAIRSTAEAPHGSAAIRIRGSDEGIVRSARIRDCTLSLGLNDTGILAIGVRDTEVDGCDIEVPGVALDIRDRLARDDSFASLVGRVFLSQLSFNVDDELFVGGAAVEFPSGEIGRHNIALAGWGNDPVRFSTHSSLDARLWDRIAQTNPPGNRAGGQPSMRAHLRRLRRRLARISMGVSDTGGPGRPPTGGRPAPGRDRDIVLEDGGLLAPAPPGRPILDRVADRFAALETLPGFAVSPMRILGQLILQSAQREYGQAGIVVAAPFGPFVSGNSTPSDRVFDPRGQSARITRNRIDGFHQGIRIGGDRRASGLDLQRTIFRDVEVDGNRIELRLPMYARPRWGIMVGSAASVAVRNNRVVNPLVIGPNDAVPIPLSPTDGIRLWGVFGAFVQLERNACFGTTNGVRFRALNPLSDPARTVWKVSDLGGDGAIPANALAESIGQAEIVEIP